MTSLTNQSNQWQIASTTLNDRGQYLIVYFIVAFLIASLIIYSQGQGPCLSDSECEGGALCR